MPHSEKLLSHVLLFALILAFMVVAMGAYTRLADAGLGCPDWPGCYGHLGVPEAEQINSDLHERPLEKGKAWKEMIHRYIAGALGLLILLIFFLSFKKKYTQSPVLPSVLLVVVIFQALLGMWTVTLLLSPMIVSAHLIGGFTTLSLLWWLYLNNKPSESNDIHTTALTAPSSATSLKIIAAIGLLLVIVQILLGGWTSTNYAALACGTSFPTCAQQWWPAMDFANGFDISHTEGVNYEFGILESPARTAIQVAHRIGALVLSLYLLFLSIHLLKQAVPSLRKMGIVLLIVLATQITLGILNVVLALPLSIAVLHNVVAAFLLLTIIAINHQLHRQTR